MMMRSRTLAVALALVATAVTAACSRVPPLANTQPTPAALAGAVLDALARRDRAALDALALNETEFRDHAWPQLPAARPERNLPFSYVWGELRQKSGIALGLTLEGHGGRGYELVDVQFEGETDYVTYRVHREATFLVKDGTETMEIRVCGSMIEKDGAWKVFSYVVDD